MDAVLFLQIATYNSMTEALADPNRQNRDNEQRDTVLNKDFNASEDQA